MMQRPGGKEEAVVWSSVSSLHSRSHSSGVALSLPVSPTFLYRSRVVPCIRLSNIVFILVLISSITLRSRWLSCLNTTQHTIAPRHFGNSEKRSVSERQFPVLKWAGWEDSRRRNEVEYAFEGWMDATQRSIYYTQSQRQNLCDCCY